VTLDQSPPGPARYVRVEVLLDETVAVTGMSLRLHFNAALLTFEALETFHSNGFLGLDVRTDSTDADGDPATNRFIVVGWNDLDTGWPGAGSMAPHSLFRARFLQGTAATTTLRFSAPSHPPGFPIDAMPFTVPLN
jgi:hypothetical protein